MLEAWIFWCSYVCGIGLSYIGYKMCDARQGSRNQKTHVVSFGYRLFAVE